MTHPNAARHNTGIIAARAKILRGRGLLLAAIVLVSHCITSPATAQDNRPIPYPAFPAPQFLSAVEVGTRTLTGEPGPQYWTNTAEYRIKATLSPFSNMLRGSEEVIYQNNSPDTLRRIVVNLYQNLHSEGVVRSESVQVTGGMHVSQVALNGMDLVEARPVSLWRRQTGPVGTSYSIRGTKMTIQVPDGVAPGEAARLNMSWSFEVPAQGAPRMGQDGEVYYLGYWYPQVAVYDDLRGWDPDPYAGEGEFYMGYADYDVSITVPEGWLVGATGELQNGYAVLTEQTRSRLASVADSDSTVHIVTADDRGAGRSTVDSPTGALTWRFTAENVRDFAFGTSASYVWDAGRTAVGDLDDDSESDYAMIHALYRPDARTWDQAAHYSAYSIEFLSRTVMPYPYPQMTSVEGIIGGGMEYPMITLIGGNRNERTLMSVTIHELAHMWFPMIVGQDEKAYTWMDEGMVTFNENDGEEAYWESPIWPSEQQMYLIIARSEIEEPSMKHADSYRSPFARNVAHYAKPGITFHALRGIVGNDRFYEALQEYTRRWAFKHPSPWDMFNTFEDVLDMDLDWFFRSWIYEAWVLDQAVASVEQTADGIAVTIADYGLTPMPAPVRVKYADGRVENQLVPVDHWLDDNVSAVLTFPAGDVVEVEIDPEGYYSDIDVANNVWVKPDGATH